MREASHRLGLTDLDAADGVVAAPVGNDFPRAGGEGISDQGPFEGGALLAFGELGLVGWGWSGRWDGLVMGLYHS